MFQLIIRCVCFSNNLSLAVLDKFYDIKIFSLYSGRVKMLHNMYIYDIPIAAIPHMCEGLINLFKCIKIQNPPITENRKGFLFNRGE
jgi:hypothetical protein